MERLRGRAFTDEGLKGVTHSINESINHSLTSSLIHSLDVVLAGHLVHDARKVHGEAQREGIHR